MTAGFYWHLHHDKLFEWCQDYEKWVAFFKTAKPPHEVEARLRLFAPVKGLLPPRLVKAWVAYLKAEAAYGKAGAALPPGKAGAACNKAWAAYDKARVACNNAWAACNKAEAACKTEVEALHAVECPDCPWDGKTIFPASTQPGA